MDNLARLLLSDKTTGKNILWATKSYEGLGDKYSEASCIEYPLISGENGYIIQPRTRKSRAEQTSRTKKMAEVFTPLWICKKMNDVIDDDFFGYTADITRENTDFRKIKFPENKSWRDYIALRQLEITCGEAPFIVTRYDAATGEPVPINRRVGILDRKLRMINALAADDEYMPAVTAAYQSTYGYEWQGDNLLIARLNLLHSFIEYYTARYKAAPPDKEVRKIANIITWNLWQMNGLSGRIPRRGANSPAPAGLEDDPARQMSLFADEPDPPRPPLCVLRDWKGRKKVRYIDLAK